MAMQVMSATFNAFAFAGAGFLFSKLDHKGYAEEIKRHNEAMEKLTKDRDEWNKARLKEIDRIQNLRYDKVEGYKDIQSTNHDLLQVQTKFNETKPVLSNYYKPSPKMNEYIDVVKLAMIAPIAYGAFLLI